MSPKVERISKSPAPLTPPSCALPTALQPVLRTPLAPWPAVFPCGGAVFATLPERSLARVTLDAPPQAWPRLALPGGTFRADPGGERPAYFTESGDIFVLDPVHLALDHHLAAPDLGAGDVFPLHDGAILVAPERGWLRGLRVVQDGRVRWRRRSAWHVRAALRALLILHERAEDTHALSGVDPASGEILWRWRGGATVDIVGRVGDRVWLSEGGEAFVALDAQDGVECARIGLGGFFTTPAVGPDGVAHVLAPERHAIVDLASGAILASERGDFYRLRPVLALEDQAVLATDEAGHLLRVGGGTATPVASLPSPRQTVLFVWPIDGGLAVVGRHRAIPEGTRAPMHELHLLAARSAEV